MANTDVYAPTTTANPKSSLLMLPTDKMEKIRCLIKVLEVLLSLVAFILEEVVSSCTSCSALYFFEFISCTAFLFTLLLLILLYTALHTKVGISAWPRVDFIYTAVIAVLFFIASIAFASNNGDTTIERSAVVFGFLATAAFVADFVLFVKNNGFPFTKDGKQESSNGGVATSPAEQEKLNTHTNGP